MAREVEFDHFAGMTRNEMQADPNWRDMYRLYCAAWDARDWDEVDRLLPKLGMRRSGMSVDWMKR